MGLSIIQLCDLLDEFGKEPVEKVLAEFSCPKNIDIEYFIKNKAILYENTYKSRTYLVFSDSKENISLIAYFTLCSRPIEFCDDISNGRKRKILGTSFEINGQLSAILIGQFGKNYNNNNNILITGKDLYDLALHKVLSANKLIGGRIVYLECEDNPFLRKFYEGLGMMLYVDDDDKPILNSHGLLTYIIATKNIKIAKNFSKERRNEILVTG